MNAPRYGRAWLAAALCVAQLLAAGMLRAAEESADDLLPPAPLVAAERIGWLRSNTQGEVDAPYALIDSLGMVRCYVRTPPGWNLRPFLNQKIRIRGAALTPAGMPGFTLEASDVSAPDGRVVHLHSVGERHSEAAASRPVDSGVVQAGYQQPVPDPVMSEELPNPTPMPADGGVLPPNFDGGADGPMGNGFAPGGCASCDGGGCGRPLCSRCGTFCGPPGLTWARAEYLFWWTQGMSIPPLVTTGPSLNQPGYLYSPGTAVLFGGNQVDGYGRSGGRLTLGTWFNNCQTAGIEGDFFQLATATANYTASSNGTPILSRPFFDVNPAKAEQNVQLVAAPDVISGTVSVDTYTRFLGAGARLRLNLCCSQNCSCNPCFPTLSGPNGYRVDLLLGYRYLRLADGVSVNENLTSLMTTLPGTFQVNDSFRSLNQFNGIDFGTAWLSYRGRWMIELVQRLALGNTNQIVDINGSTVTTPTGGASTTSVGGLLAQTSNIGHYSRNAFAVVPELDANLAFAITPHLRAVIGYTFIYWSNVARAGSQIDTDVNSTLLPNSPSPPTGDTSHPQFTYHETPFWAQGISAGLDYRW